jgi:hypothetical protein
MAKTGEHHMLSDAQWDELVREFLKKLAQTATRNRGSATHVARALNKSMSAVTEMKSSGKGSVVSWVRLAKHLTGMSDVEAQRLLEDPSAILRSLEQPSEIESLFSEVRRHYTDLELAAWLKLLLAKSKVEADLGIQVRATLQKTPKPKNK